MFEAIKPKNLFRRAHEAETARQAVSQRSMFTAWLATTGALLVVSMLISVDATTGIKLNQAGANSADPDSPVAVGLANSDDPAFSSVVYGSLEWTLVDTRLVPREKESFSRPVVILDMVVRNLDGQYQARARSRDIVLILEDGTRAPMDRFEHTASTYRIAIDPGEVQPVTLVFKPVVTRDPWLPDVKLEIGELHHHPAVLPLDGSVSPTIYPLPATVESPQGQSSTNVKTSTGAIEVAVQKAGVDINAGPYRARLHEQLVVVEINVNDSAGDTNPETRSIPAWTTRDFWQLTTTSRSSDSSQNAAEPINPHLVSTLPVRGVGDGSAPKSVVLVFALPADLTPTSMTLTAGPAASPIGSIHVSATMN